MAVLCSVVSLGEAVQCMLHEKSFFQEVCVIVQGLEVFIVLFSVYLRAHTHRLLVLLSIV